LKRIALVMFLMLFVTSPSVAANFFPLSSVHRGMKGYIRTVIYGTKVSSFKVEVLGILKRSNGSHLILIKAFPDLVEKTGGIAAGMSGSPLFIDGKIVGAIGYGWRMADHSLGLVTPIKEMLSVWDWYKERKRRKIEKIRLQQALLYDGRKYKWLWISEKKVNAPPGTIVMTPVATPIVVSGLSERGKRIISDYLSKIGNFKIVDVPDDVGISRRVHLQPGSAIGVEVTKGDINIGAIGTLTYIDHKTNRMVGFGHPFLLRGDVDYFLTDAFVYQIVKSIDIPFKLGVPLKVIGSLVEDRKKAIGGIIGRFPKSMSVRVVVVDEDHHRVRRYGFRINRDGELTPVFLSAALMSCIDRGWGRIGEGTSKVSFSLIGYGLPMDVKRTNYFWSPKDISKVSVQEIKDLSILLLRNEYRNVSAESLDVVVNVSKRNRILFIKGADVKRHGSKLVVNISLKHFRGGIVRKKVTLSIPKMWDGVPFVVVVRGGGMVGLNPKESKKSAPKTYKSLKEELKDFLAGECNNELVVEVFPLVSKMPRGFKDSLKKRVKTGYYIEGYIEKRFGLPSGKR